MIHNSPGVSQGYPNKTKTNTTEKNLCTKYINNSNFITDLTRHWYKSLYAKRNPLN